MKSSDLSEALRRLFRGNGIDAVARSLGLGVPELESALLGLVPPEKPIGPVVNVDAGSRGNPGPSAYAFVIEPDDVHGDFVGPMTNNEAEYRGLVEALKYLDANSIHGARIVMDSKLVVSQVNGIWKIKEPRLAVYAKEAVALKKKVGASLVAVPRLENTVADDEVNRILDLNR